MSALRYVAVFGATFVGGVAGLVPVYLMGLEVSMLIVGPLTLLSTSIVAALLTIWSANFIATDGSRSRLIAVLAYSGIAAVLGLLVRLAVVWAVNTFDLGFELWVTLLVYPPAAFVFSGIVTVVALRVRAPGGRLGWGGGLMLLMAASILVFSILTSPTVVVLESYWLERHYRIVALLGLTVVLASAFAGLRISRQIASGRELMRDAAITLSLAVALPLVLYGVTYAACSIPTYCGA